MRNIFSLEGNGKKSTKLLYLIPSILELQQSNATITSAIKRRWSMIMVYLFLDQWISKVPLLLRMIDFGVQSFIYGPGRDLFFCIQLWNGKWREECTPPNGRSSIVVRSLSTSGWQVLFVMAASRPWWCTQVGQVLPS